MHEHQDKDLQVQNVDQHLKDDDILQATVVYMHRHPKSYY